MDHFAHIADYYSTRHTGLRGNIFLFKRWRSYHVRCGRTPHWKITTDAHGNVV